MSGQSIVLIPDPDPDPASVEALAAAMELGERALGAAVVLRAQHSGRDYGAATVLVTSRRILVGKQRMLGRVKVNIAIDLKDIESAGFGPLMGVGPTWETHFSGTTAPGLFYLRGPNQAEALRDLIVRGAADAQGIGQSNSAGDGAGSPDGDFDEGLAALHDLIDDLRVFATPELVARPFGEGAGLTEALDLLRRRTSDGQLMREWDHMVALDILVATGPKSCGPDEIAEVMGATQDAAIQNGVPSAVAGNVGALCGAAVTFLGQFTDRQGDMWDLWSRNDEVAAEFLVFHVVARLRLASAGYLDSLTRPAVAVR